ncbi:MAG: SDR family NAD(P)-dependent oxidoreductase [Chloroflexi bacterium]|nr:SDR family NAD(P)-dependent oxidoreductase [Chloroflexota bacterium]
MSEAFGNRVAFVTGGGSGIGRATSLRLAGRGAAVAVVDRNPTGAAETVDLIIATGGRAIAIDADATSEEAVNEAVRRATSDLGSAPTILVNNASSGGGDDPLSTSVETWDRVMVGALRSQFVVSKAILPGMIEAGRGSIVCVSTVNGLMGIGDDAYSAAKAGVINFAKNLAVRYGQYGIRANVVCPGTVQTPAWTRRLQRTPDIFDRLTPWYPIGRVGQADDIAAAITFLASDDASFITGVVLPVDGGLTAGMWRMGRDLQGD